MSEGVDPRNPMLPALEGLAAVEEAGTVEAALRAAVEAACLTTASPRGFAGLSDGEAVTAQEWFDADEGWTGTPQRWPIGDGAPGRVCASGAPLACNDLSGSTGRLPEATGILSLTRSACVPLPGAAGEPLGFLEVGNRKEDYTADEVRCLRVIAARTAAKLQALAAGERLEAERRLCSEALVGGRELFSLEPGRVLAEAAARVRELTGAGDVSAPRLDGPGRAAIDALPKEERAVLEEAARTCAPVAGAHVLAIPLLGAARPLGALVVRDAPAPPSAERLRALAALATRAGVALEHAILYENQAETARRLQERLLPLEPPEIRGLDIAVAYQSASHGAGRGGDFVDFYSRTGGHLALVVGDVAGKGIDAVATTLVVKYVVRAAVSGGALSWPTRPGVALQELHNAMLGELGGESFVTALFALVGVRRGMLQLATAGHPSPFVIRSSGVERPLLLTAPAIGIDLEAALSAYPSEVIDLERGDCVVFFTDGITELRDADGEFFEDAMPEALAGLHDRPAADVLSHLLEQAERFSARPAADDIAVVCLRLTRRPDVKKRGRTADTAGKEYADDGGTRES